MRNAGLVAGILGVPLLASGGLWGQDAARKNLPSSKELGAVPGNPQQLNSLPMSVAVSPDGRYVVTVNAGYGTYESRYRNDLAVMDSRAGKVTDFPDARTATTDKQTLYSGLAFSADGKHVYASMASLTEPVAGQGTGTREQGTANTGNGIAVYSFHEGKIAPERLIPIPLQQLAGGRKTKLIGGTDGAMGVPFPAAIAVVRMKCAPTGEACEPDRKS